MSNEKYIRDHPELNTIISVFLFRILEEKPENILAYAGRYFDKYFFLYFLRKLLCFNLFRPDL